MIAMTEAESQPPSDSPEAADGPAVATEGPSAGEGRVEVRAPAEPGGEPAAVSDDLAETMGDDLAGTTAEVLGRPPTRLISPRIHGMLDYLTGSLLVAAPAVLGLRYGSAAGRALWMAGAAHAGYSIFTDYELGAVRAIPMRVHLALDTAGAVALATSPWALVKRRRDWRHWAPHAFLGVYELVAVAMSDPGE